MEGCLYGVVKVNLGQSAGAQNAEHFLLGQPRMLQKLPAWIAKEAAAAQSVALLGCEGASLGRHRKLGVQLTARN
jgi:hypothetical protein